MKPYRATELCQLDGRSCFGCCGRNWGSKEEVLVQIGKNTTEFSQSEDKMQFRLRADPEDLPFGTCRNLIFDKGKTHTTCPLHPALNNGTDLRVGHCDINYLCKTAKAFNKWDVKKQERFLTLLRQEKDDLYTYSMSMDQDKYLKQFKKQEKTTSSSL